MGCTGLHWIVFDCPGFMVDGVWAVSMYNVVVVVVVLVVVVVVVVGCKAPL